MSHDYGEFTNSILGMEINKHKWNYTAGLIVPLIGVFAPTVLFDQVNKINALKNVQQPIKAVLVGTIITLLCWVLMSYVIKEKNPLHTAVLCGLLSAQVMVFSGSKFPGMASITLWLFFYYNSIENH